MVENIFRQIAARRGTSLNIKAIIIEAAAQVDRPLFYAVAVIVASFLPIYVLAGPSRAAVEPLAPPAGCPALAAWRFDAPAFSPAVGGVVSDARPCTAALG